MAALLAVFAVLCTAHYFCALLQRPAQLAAMLAVARVWQITLVALYRFGVAVGIAGMIFLGLKEVWYFLAGSRLGIAYDDVLGIGCVIVALLLLRGFERTAREATARSAG